MAAARASLEAKAARLRRERRHKAAEEIERLLEQSSTTQETPTSGSKELEVEVAPSVTIASDPDEAAWRQSLQEIKDRLAVLQQTIGLKVGPSISYDSISDVRIRCQLLSDNIRMENARLDVSTYERYGQELAFRRFCVFAFFQVEELINLWLHNEYGKDIVRMKLEFRTNGVTLSEAKNAPINSLADISMGSKIYFFTLKRAGHKILHDLRSVRNIEEHRCTVLLAKNDGDVSALRVNYEQVKPRLAAEKTKQADLRAKTYAEDKDVENKYFTAIFLKDPSTNAEKVREELRQLYKIVSATQKTAN